jgi:hypothetical protein
MGKLVTKSFKVDSEAWDNFVKIAQSHGSTPAELFRELISHANEAMEAVQSGRIQNFDGDIAKLIRVEFPQLTPLQLQTMAEVLTKAAGIDVSDLKQQGRIKNRKITP